jgi:Phage portal protein
VAGPASAERTRAIMRAIKATNPQAGSFGTVTPPSIGPGPSPLVASYGEWTSGRSQGTHADLPRDAATFLSGMFGPLAPIRTIPVDTPDPGEDRPQPRRRQYPIGWDMPMGMPGTEGWGKLADFTTLRTLADLYSVARACIDLRKAELRGIGWDIALTKTAAKALRGSTSGMADFAKRRDAAVKFFRRPDPVYADFSSWFDTILEEIFVTDALAIYVQPALSKTKGLLGSHVGALDLIDGALIRPMVDVRGGPPPPPNPAFQQFLYGVPRVDLMTLLLGEDNPDHEGLVAEYAGDQLMYLPYNQRTWTVYGQAPIERAIIPVMTGLNKQGYQLNFFQEGSIPGLFVSPGDPMMTPAQIRELQDALNALAGDQAWKHKIIVLPGGSKVDPQKPVPLADQFDEIIMTQVCMAFQVMPMELGISPRVSSTQSTGAANQMAKACYTSNVEVLTRSGWKFFQDVDITVDEIATRNPKTHAFEWQQATAYHEYDHDGELVEFFSTHGRQAKDEGLHLTVTPNHRMLTVEPISKTKPVEYREYVREAGKIGALRISVPLTSAWEGHGPQSVRFGKYEWSASDFAAFLGMWIAEGHLDRQRGYYKRGGQWARRPEGHIVKRIRISQQPTSKGYESYRELLTRMLGREPGYNHGNFYFACAELWDYLDELGHAADKHVPVEVKNWSAPALGAFLDFYLLGDGYLENGAWRAKLASRRLADDLQEIVQKLGMSATITPLKPKDVMIRGRIIKAENCQPQYLVRINKSATRRLTRRVVKHTGKVRCVSVPNGIIYVRQNGSPVWCGNSQDIQERKGVVPLLLWLKSALFDTILQKVCGQEDLEWQWEGLEEDEDAETLTNLLVQQVSAGLRSIDEARQELGLDPWNLPITSDPGWASQMAGFMPLSAVPTEPPPPPGQMPPGQQPQQPGQQQKPPPRPGQQQPSSTPALPSGKPRSALTAPKPGGQSTSVGTPAHAAAGATTASKPKPAAKALDRELDLLRNHLRKGGRVADWQPMSLPGWVLAVLGEDLDKGLSPEEATGVVRDLITGKRQPASGLAGQVYDYLAKHYPASVLGWVEDADWHGPVRVQLKQINMARRSGGARDEAKVTAIAAAVRAGEKLDPVVLVDVPGASKFQIADGWHRTLAVKHADQSRILAWVGQVDTAQGPWADGEMNRAKLNKTGGGAGPKGRPRNPGWDHDQALAARFATQLARELAAAVPARDLARNWLARTQLMSGKARRRRGGAAGWLQETTAGAALTAVLTAILRQVWTAGYGLGQQSAAQLLEGLAEVSAEQQALDQLIQAGEGRIPGMVETRLEQIADVLDGTGPGATVESLETSLVDVIGSVARALQVTQTEITWSMAEGMLGWFFGAGVRTIGWLTAEDDRVCPRCAENEAEGWIPAGDDFPSGDTQPPAHPSCRCALIPGDIKGSPLPVAWPR